MQDAPRPIMNTVKPPRLRDGDVIGLVSPAGPMTHPGRIEQGVRYLEQRGYRVRVGRHALKTFGYLAGSDQERLEDLHSMFRDPEVKAIFCIRGGYGTSRLLPALDYALIARNPKILLGFSDITALQLALWRKCRLVTFQGPMVQADLSAAINAYSESKLWPLLAEPKPHCLCSDEGLARRNGSASGRLLGGNLSLIVSLLGTPFQPDLRRSLLFIEEVAEAPYRLDRMLTHLGNSGAWDRINGLLLGQLPHCRPHNPGRSSFSADQVLAGLAKQIGKPMVSDLPFGHVARKLTLPIGIKAQWNPALRQLQLLEPPVV